MSELETSLQSFHSFDCLFVVFRRLRIEAASQRTSESVSSSASSTRSRLQTSRKAGEGASRYWLRFKGRLFIFIRVEQKTFPPGRRGRTLVCSIGLSVVSQSLCLCSHTSFLFVAGLAKRSRSSNIAGAATTTLCFAALTITWGQCADLRALIRSEHLKIRKEESRVPDASG